MKNHRLLTHVFVYIRSTAFIIVAIRRNYSSSAVQKRHSKVYGKPIGGIGIRFSLIKLGSKVTAGWDKGRTVKSVKYTFNIFRPYETLFVNLSNLCFMRHVRQLKIFTSVKKNRDMSIHNGTLEILIRSLMCKKVSFFF